MRRFLLCAWLLQLFLLTPTAVLAETPTTNPPPSQVGDDLCTADYQINHWGSCPLYGPGGFAQREHQYDLPSVLSPLATLPIPAPTVPPLSYTYAKVTAPDSQVFLSPQDALNGIVERTLGKGYIYVSYNNLVSAGGQQFMRINNGEYVKAADVATVTPSNYQGISLAKQPERSFAWVVRPFQPRLTPEGRVNPAATPLVRYDIVQIYGKEKHGQYDWYLVGRDQWVEQRNLGVVDVTAPPTGITGNAKWISVNLFEQTMAVYEGTRMVYASLVSSGLGAWPTRPGTYQIYKKLENTNMSGAFAADKGDYYFVEDVPWVMYFDQSISFHGTYWHDKYGFQESHGCVNLSPKDSLWLYNWANVGTTVVVYDPSGRTPSTPWTGGGP